MSAISNLLLGFLDEVAHDLSCPGVLLGKNKQPYYEKHDDEEGAGAAARALASSKARAPVPLAVRTMRAARADKVVRAGPTAFAALERHCAPHFSTEGAYVIRLWGSMRLRFNGQSRTTVKFYKY